ncbi:MAG: sigma-70 family RNA polymerase sigma factor [Armatimonadota bacterium]
MATAKRQAPDRDEIDALVRDYRRAKAAEERALRRAAAGARQAANPRTGLPAANRPSAAALRDRLIAQHLYLVQTAARKFAGLGESHEDLLQEGAMGLINAVDLYDPDRGVQFSTYATHLVEGQIRHYLRDRGKLIKQPAWVQELTTRIVKASDALTQQLNRPPTPEEIAHHVGTSPDNVRRMLEARERSKVASLDAARSEDDDQSPAVDPEKLRSDDHDGLHLPIEDRIFLRDAISRLKTLERRVVHNFYYLDLNQTEIARKLGISVNYASYLLRGAVVKLRKAFDAQTREAASVVADAPAALERPEPPSLTARPSPLPPTLYSLSLRPSAPDPLTHLATEGHFGERVEQEVMRASRYPQQFSLLLVEPDWPPLAGHAAAPPTPPPALSVEVGRLLRSNCRSIDLVAKLGGGRFGLLLPHTGREAAVLAQRICSATRACRGLEVSPSAPSPTQSRPGADNAGHWPVTISIGFAVFPTDGSTSLELFEAAHQALLSAKTQGGNRSLRAQPPTHATKRAGGAG